MGQKSLKDGVSWKDGFCDGLMQSCSFVPILSKKGIKHQFDSLVDSSSCDNVLLVEHALGLEFKLRGLVDFVFPIFVGEFDSSINEYGDYFVQGCYPLLYSDRPVLPISVKTALTMHVERIGLGTVYLEHFHIKTVFDHLTKNQGFKTLKQSSMSSLLDDAADRIKIMIMS